MPAGPLMLCNSENYRVRIEDDPPLLMGVVVMMVTKGIRSRCIDLP